MILFDSAANLTPLIAGSTSVVILLGITIIIVIIAIRRKRKGYVSLFVGGFFLVALIMRFHQSYGNHCRWKAAIRHIFGKIPSDRLFLPIIYAIIWWFIQFIWRSLKYYCITRLIMVLFFWGGVPFDNDFGLISLPLHYQEQLKPLFDWCSSHRGLILSSFE